MAKISNPDSVCNNCTAPVLPLYQSYSDGSWNCPACILRVDSMMPSSSREAIERRIQKGNQARRNFQQSAAKSASLF